MSKQLVLCIYQLLFAEHPRDSLLSFGDAPKLQHVQGLPATFGHERPCGQGASQEVQQKRWSGTTRDLYDTTVLIRRYALQLVTVCRCSASVSVRLSCCCLETVCVVGSAAMSTMWFARSHILAIPVPVSLWHVLTASETTDDLSNVFSSHDAYQVG